MTDTVQKTKVNCIVFKQKVIAHVHEFYLCILLFGIVNTER